MSTDGGVSWVEFAREAPELAADVRACFARTKHHVLATLRRSGAPRVSGTEVVFSGDHLVLGSMGGSRKSADLMADGRLALHANPGDGSMEGGDAKLSGLAAEIGGEELAAVVGDENAAQGARAFRVGLSDVVHTAIHPSGDRLVIRLWRPGRGVTTTERF